jgi:hypothetical protein
MFKGQRTLGGPIFQKVKNRQGDFDGKNNSKTYRYILNTFYRNFESSIANLRHKVTKNKTKCHYCIKAKDIF